MTEAVLSRTFRVLFRDITAADPRRRRLIGILQGAVTSLGSRVLSMAISFVSVPLTIGYLGKEQYGAWVTIGSLLAWLNLTDFGLGNGLTNAIATAVGQDRPDQVRMHLSNAVVLFSAIALGVAFAAGAVWPFVDWSALLGVRSPEAHAEVGPAVIAAFAIFLAQFPLSAIGKLYLAYQEGRIGNMWGVGSNLLSLLALVIVTQTGGGLLSLVLAVSGTPMLVGFVNAVWLLGWHRPGMRPSLRCVDLGAMRLLSGTAGKFFLIQILSLIVFQTDNLVVGHFLGADHVPEYSLTYTLFNYTSLPQSILFGYLWVAYSEAIARHDVAWVRRAFRLNLGLGMAGTAAAVVCLCFITRPFIAWWAGPTVAPGPSLVAWMAAWALINAFTNPIACLLAAAAHLRAQITYSAVATALNVALSIWLVQRWGVDGVIAGTVISYLIFVCGPVWLDARRLLRRLEGAV